MKNKISVDIMKHAMESNAVLTPHLNHPDYKKGVRLRGGSGSACFNPEPLRQYEIDHIKRWCLIQEKRLPKIPSNAVLTGAKR